MNDLWAQYMGKPGELNHQAKLTESQAWAIRWNYLNGISDAAIASTFGVARGTVWDIGSGRTWKHINP